MRMRPIYKTAVVRPMGGTVIIHPALAAATSRSAGALVVTLLCLHHGLLGNEAGGEIAPQRHDCA